ncbi:MAG: 2-succinyl-6-hydroxy-2,4-cyclohexadiene-1-carboxylate synthase [Myxococcales bacterium]|nr:2-succinyl-6-hydroxy-2,4-cyclohexadiene-1-carboxylate synthase [Myxococcales bacterium]
MRAQDGGAAAPWRVHRMGAGRPLLALHGFTGGGRDFETLAARVPAAWIAPDLPGHGGTRAPATFADTVAALIEIGGAAPFDLLGYSLGGRVALALAVAHPDRVRRLVLVGATPGIEAPAERAVRRALDAERAQRLEAEGVAAFLADWQAQPLIATQARIDPPTRAVMAAVRRAQTAAGLAASLRGLGTGSMPPLWDALGAVRCPTLLVAGAEDEKFVGVARRMARRMPAARRWVVPGAGHCAHLEAAAIFGARLRRFLSGA